MLLAILPSASDAEKLLNNLSEADFNLDDVSVVMQDANLRNKIAKDTGPLKGMQPTQMQAALSANLSHDALQRGMQAVNNGKVLVAMKVDPKYEAAAREMFTDMKAELLQD